MEKVLITPKEYNIHMINSIKSKYPDLRQASKPITFALTYAGTWATLVQNLNLPEDEAKEIERKYHELYKESDLYVRQHIEEATKTGYVVCAFGLKLRTPLLKTALTEGRNALKEVKREARTAGNALGQSWGLLNCRSCNEVMEQVWNSPYRYDILPCCQIHDALYFYIKDSIKVLTWFNKVLIKAMEWQDDPAIYHDEIKLGGDLEVFYPDWAHGIEIKNNASEEEVFKTLKEASKHKE